MRLSCIPQDYHDFCGETLRSLPASHAHVQYSSKSPGATGLAEYNTHKNDRKDVPGI